MPEQRSQMEWWREKDFMRHTSGIHFKGFISDQDRMDMERAGYWSHHDEKLIQDCYGEGRTPADWLLALERIWFRLSQWEASKHAKEEENSQTPTQ